MADTKISALSAASTPLDGTEVLPIVQSGTTKKVTNNDLRPQQIQSNANSGVMQILGPSAAATRVMTIPDANFTAARTDAAQTFTGLQTFATAKISNASSGTYFTIENTDPSIGGGESIQMELNYTNFSALSTNWSFLSRYAGANFQLISNTNNAGGVVRLILESGGPVTPGVDNTQTLGSSSTRWSVVYAATGTINTSDARDKQDVLNVSDAEKATALQIKGLLKSFRFKDAVAEKGDGARIHFGAVAQEVAQAFRDNGLDPEKYALFCYDEWDDKFEPVIVKEEYVDDDGVTQVRSIDTGEVRQTIWAGDRYGLRYEELLCFVVAAL